MVAGTEHISDGYHTFGELYDHRRALTAALVGMVPNWSWKSREHHPDDDPMFEGGYFIVGVDLPTGTITYHYKWDGAGQDVTVDRLLTWARE